MEKTSVLSRKKKILIQVITKLIPYRNLARGVLALVESSYVDEKTIDGVMQTLALAIKNTRKQEEKERLEEGIAMIEKGRKREAKEKEKEAGEIENLLDNM